MPDTFSFTLDGAPVSVVCDPKTPALEVLREQLGVTGVKAGCSPQGMCGCCTVIVDGKPRLTCTLPTKSLAGKSVTTLASVPAATQTRLAGAFAATHAAQCGYCTPAIVLSASTLWAAEREPNDDDVHRVLMPHTCRCTGYTSIKAAIGLALAPGDAPFGDARPADLEAGLGTRLFVDDLVRPGTLHGAVVFGGFPSGNLRGIDATIAMSMPGNVRYLQLKPDGAAIAHAGELVAAVVADTRAAARAAAAAVHVTIDPAPLAEATPIARAVRREGNVEAAFAAAAHRAAAVVSFAATDAVPLEPEAAFALPDGSGGLIVYSSGHDAAGLAAALSAELRVPTRVILVPSGGSYGARAVASVEAVAARLALLAGAPVRLALEHEEGTRLRVRRPGSVVTAELACDVSGKLLGARVLARFAGGCVAHEAERLLARAVDAMSYDIADLEIVAEIDRTSGTPTGPVRGAGSLPITVVLEGLVDRLAGAVGEDPLRFRERNLSGHAAALFAALRSQGGETTSRQGAAIARIAGGEGAQVVLTVRGDAEIEVACNVPELGQGRDAQLVASLVQATGLHAAIFEVVWGDSDVLATPGEGPVDASARAAGAALVAAGGSLADLVGRRFEGRSGAAPDEIAACLVRMADDGTVAAVDVLVATGDQDAAAARSLAEGGAAMGIGVALAEEVAERDGAAETRFRYLGTLKEKVTPRVVGTPLDVGGGARGVAEAAVIAAASAAYVAVSAFEGVARASLPMKESAAARGVGIRVRGSAPASG